MYIPPELISIILGFAHKPTGLSLCHAAIECYQKLQDLGWYTLFFLPVSGPKHRIFFTQCESDVIQILKRVCPSFNEDLYPLKMGIWRELQMIMGGYVLPRKSCSVIRIANLLHYRYAV